MGEPYASAGAGSTSGRCRARSRGRSPSARSRARRRWSMLTAVALPSFVSTMIPLSGRPGRRGGTCRASCWRRRPTGGQVAGRRRRASPARRPCSGSSAPGLPWLAEVVPGRPRAYTCGCARRRGSAGASLCRRGRSRPSGRAPPRRCRRRATASSACVHQVEVVVAVGRLVLDRDRLVVDHVPPSAAPAASCRRALRVARHVERARADVGDEAVEPQQQPAVP